MQDGEGSRQGRRSYGWSREGRGKGGKDRGSGVGHYRGVAFVWEGIFLHPRRWTPFLTVGNVHVFGDAWPCPPTPLVRLVTGLLVVFLVSFLRFHALCTLGDVVVR